MTTALAARPAGRLNPDSLPVLIAATTAAVVVLVASFLWSWDALVAVSGWAGTRPERAWVVPVVLDGAVVVYTLAVLVQRARGRRAVVAWAALGCFTAASVVLNTAHAIGVPAALERAIGGTVAGLAPIAVLLATHTLAALLVHHPARTTTAASAGQTAGAASAGQTDTGAAGQTGVVVPLALTIWDTPGIDVTSPVAVPPVDGAPRLDTAPGAVPVVLVTGRVPELHDVGPVSVRPGAGRADGGEVGRTTVRRVPAARGRVADRAADIVHLALTTSSSGRRIADDLGLDRTAVCALVTQTRAGQTTVSVGGTLALA